MTRDSYSPDVRIVDVDGREYILVGTAHISRESADLVHEVIEHERPDAVCLELDRQRFAALANPDNFANLDLRQVIRDKQLSTLLINLMLASYQRRLGDELGVLPGTEMKEAADTAERLGIPSLLCDRDIRITLRRAWAAIAWWRKLWIVPALVASLFDRPEITEDDLRKLRQEDAPNKLIEELGDAFPTLRTALIDERDQYITEKIRQAPGQKVVVVVGAGHLRGIERALINHERIDLAPLEVIPPTSRVWMMIGWAIPALILGAIGYIGYSQGARAAGDNFLFWILANGVPAGIGALVALAHPITTATAFLAAPFTSLTPLIGVGYVAAFAQLYLRPPLVSELQSVQTDVAKPPMWWRNRLLRILLVFVLTTIGSSIGTFVGGGRILANLFGS